MTRYEKEYYGDIKDISKSLKNISKILNKKETKMNEYKKIKLEIIDKQIDTETGGDGEPLTNETLQALEQERERLEKLPSGIPNKNYHENNVKRFYQNTCEGYKNQIPEERKKLINMIKLWLKNDAEDLTIEELKQLLHFCNGGDAIH